MKKNRTTDYSTLGYNERRLLVSLLRDEELRLTGLINSANADRTVITGVLEDIEQWDDEDK